MSESIQFSEEFCSFHVESNFFLGWFRQQRNGSDEFGGHFNIHTGKDDINELGVVKNWNYQAYTKYYEDGCNHVRGKCLLSKSEFSQIKTISRGSTQIDHDTIK